MKDFEEIKRIYNNIAQAYHEKRNNPEKSTWNDLLEVPVMTELLEPLCKNKKVLDLGCGSGILSNKIRAWEGNVIGVDIAEEMIKIAKQTYPKIRFTIANAQNLPFKNNEYDIVASSLVMHYFQDLNSVFTEVSRVLVDNGYFVFSMHHPFNTSFDVEKDKEGKKVIVKPYFHNYGYYWEMCNTKILSFHHTFESIISNLRDASFRVDKLTECRPSEAVRESFNDYEFTSKYPTFVVIKAQKTV
jgi:ubiquinone/menaquinone biosynthesis C-methylase UbiE